MMLRVARASVLIGNRAILDEVSLHLAPGSVTTIIGPNGAGKSTLLGVCSGALKPNSGRVHIGETELRELSVKEAARRRAVMPQDVSVAFPFTVRDVVAMGRTPWGTSAKEDADIVTDTLRLCELGDFAEREITSLSGGERARAALARVIAQATPITSASVILLDEPTAAMDIAHAEATMRLLRTLARQGAAIGIVVHDLDAAASYADEVVLMSQGRVRASGPAAEVCTARVLSEVYETPIDVVEVEGGVRVLPRRPAGGAARQALAEAGFVTGCATP